jgi:branched-chain amino acid transport system permease protein
VTSVAARTAARSGIFSTSYRQDLALRRGRVAHAGAVAVGAGLLVLPLVLPARWHPVAVFALIAGIGAVGMHVLTGLAGQVSLGHAAFLGVGAYTATWLGADQELPAYLWLPGAGLAAAALGALVGPVATRLRGLYLAVVTLSLTFVAGWVWTVWESLTGGSSTGRSTMRFTIAGHDLFDGMTLAGLHLDGDQVWWYVALALLAAAMTTARNLQRTRIGRAFGSIRERDLTASSAGIPVTRIKTTAFVVSSFYAGIAGALLAAYQSYLLPEQWDLWLSIQFVAMIVVGGLGSVAGAVLGAAFVVVLPELVQSSTGFLPFVEERPSSTGGVSVELLSQLLYGAATVAVLVWEPGGIVGLWERFRSFWRTWPWSY